MPLPHYIAYRRPRERKPQYAVGSAAAPRTLFVKMFATLPFLCLFLYKICCLGFFPCSMRYARSNLRQLKFTETRKKDGPLLWTTVQMHPTYGVGGVHSSISGGVQCVLGFKNWFYSSIIIFIRIEDVYVGLPR